MMTNLNYVQDNILNVCNGILMHGVNCQGIMGLGVAKEIRRVYPQVYHDYMKCCSECAHPEDLLGRNCYSFIESDFIVANCFTQLYYGKRPYYKYTNVEALKCCLDRIVSDFNQQSQFKTISMPKIGCGLGGLDWDAHVKPIVEDFCNEFPDWSVYVFTGQHESRESSDSNLEPFIC